MCPSASFSHLPLSPRQTFRPASVYPYLPQEALRQGKPHHDPSAVSFLHEIGLLRDGQPLVGESIYAQPDPVAADPRHAPRNAGAELVVPAPLVTGEEFLSLPLEVLYLPADSVTDTLDDVVIHDRHRVLHEQAGALGNLHDDIAVARKGFLYPDVHL